MTLDCVGLGYHCLDLLLRIPRMPSFREHRSASVMDFKLQGGGPVSTGLVTMAKLGANPGYIGKVGDDQWGDFIIGEYKRYSVDVSHIAVEEGKTSPCVVVLVQADTGERVFLPIPTNLSPLKLTESDAEYIADSRMLFISGEEDSAVEAAQTAKQHGIPVLLDGVVGGKLENSVDMAICGQEVAYRITGTRDPQEAIEKLPSESCRVVGITLGDKGSIFRTEKRVIEQKAFSVSVVDTTGAGDVFHGALAFGFLQSWVLEEAAEFASAVSAMKCTRLGGRSGIPSLEEALSFLKQRGSSYFSKA